MTETTEKLKIELSQLSMQERAELAYFLIHSLDEDVDYDVEITWDVELARRMHEINSGTTSGEPSNKVFTELREKYLTLHLCNRYGTNLVPVMEEYT